MVRYCQCDPFVSNCSCVHFHDLMFFMVAECLTNLLLWLIYGVCAPCCRLNVTCNSFFVDLSIVTVMVFCTVTLRDQIF